jgi:hypothetical protein
MRERDRIVAATLGALLLALALLLTVVLPAEYGWDPLGTGEALGLVGLSGREGTALLREARPPQADRVTFHLDPFEAVEYKYRLERGSVLLYRWQASGELLYDMHSEPEGAAPGYAESFASARASADQGSYRAPFPGIHGWFFQNRGQQPVSVTLSTSSFAPWAVEFRDGHRARRDLSPAPAALQP